MGQTFAWDSKGVYRATIWKAGWRFSVRGIYISNPFLYCEHDQDNGQLNPILSTR